MEEYNPLGDSSAPRGNFLYSSSPPVLATHSSSPGGNFVIRSSSTNGGSIFGNHQMAIGINNNTCNVSGETSGQGYEFVKSETGGGSQSQHVHDFQYHLLREYQISSGQRQKGNDVVDVDVDVDAMKAKIVSHSQFSNLLQAFLDCQKVGAPPDVAAQLASACNGFEERQRSSMASGGGSKDQELDQFMEAYYGVLVKYREELTRPIQEAADFMQRIESQLITLCNGSLQILPSDDKCEGIGSSEEDQDNSGGGGGEKELTADQIDPRAEERELKSHLLKKYSGYLSSLKQELSKKKKKGKLPKDARQELLRWWELHNKWPYPSEAEKLALAESTGLDQKQINNWFINQRKRHWKPSEDMQFMAMDGFYHPNAAFYIDGHYMGDAHYRLGP